MVTLQQIMFRLVSAWYCLAGEGLPIPYKNYKVLAMSDDTLIMSGEGATESVEVALWAMERPKHYWRTTTLGQQVKQHVEATMGTLEEDNEY